MTTTTDLGWCIARCTITADECELLICSPASGDDCASSLSLVGLEAILALRDLIDDEVKLAESRAELSEDVGQND